MITVFKKIILLILLLVVNFFSVNNSYAELGKINSIQASSGVILQNSQSIKELKTNIIQLKRDKQDVSNTFDSFIKQHGKLKIFFKNNMEPHQINSIENLIHTYYKEKSDIINHNSGLDGNELELKINLYTAFTPFIDPNKVDGYKIFIEKDIRTVKKEKDIELNITKKTQILDKKVSIIKEKIENNQKNIQNKLNSVIEKKITLRLEQYIKNKNFKLLTKERQKQIFTKISQRIQKRILKIEIQIQDKIGENIILNKPNTQLEKKNNIYIIMKKVVDSIGKEL